MERFSGAEAAIEIVNVPDFALEIARQLVGFRNGISGYCIYGDGSLLTRELGRDPFPLPEKGQSIPIERLFDATNANGQGEEMFLKHREFSYQAEYRLIWNVDVPPDEPLIVNAPLARRFCRRLGPADIA
jgi:hypothetical protein